MLRLLPRPSVRIWPVLRRNFMVWRKLAIPSVLSNVVDPLLTLVAFGYGLGRLLPEVGGVSYITYLAAGSLCMSTMMVANFEALYSAFSRMHVQKTWDSLLNAPLELDDIVTAEWIWAGIKSLFSAITIVAVIVALDISREPTLIFLLPLSMLIGLCFGGIALCCTALARSYDVFSYYFTFITPLIFISGVYFPQDNIAPWLAVIGRVLPLAPAVDIARPLVLGQWPTAAWSPLSILLAYTVVAYWLAITLMRRRFAQ